MAGVVEVWARMPVGSEDLLAPAPLPPSDHFPQHVCLLLPSSGQSLLAIPLGPWLEALGCSQQPLLCPRCLPHGWLVSTRALSTILQDMATS